ncbi:MAG TPA: tetratricopeptide repeat protein [Ktedonobacteraceae bacterium]|jgi:serine/threonine protein kinase/cytochrome c-type biogenesis protein CcmH/NrfG|nr:tetratricopeptide repeat protein [Ktedonobacteraceae bacterium]
MPLPLGTILDGKFKIIQVLGEGGMGTVYKVEQVGKPGYYRAVKELLINPSMPEEERKAAIERFDKEIDLLFKLKHPRIPSLILSFQERGNYYFVMEFVPGRSLEKMLEDASAPLDEESVVRWMIQVCEALSYIHSQNPPIILRDLKPGNIMVMPDGNVELIDFGIARRFDPNKRTNTENLGTISYASPEHLGSITAPGQRRSAQNPGKLVQTDARSDIYSLGATMYHLLTNHEPEPIQTPAPGSIYAKNPRLHTVQIGNRIICPVEQVIIKAMQQDPAQRFQSADAMRVALQQCLAYIANPAPTTVQIPALSSNATIVVPSTATGNEVICPKCGYRNRPGAKFCKRDGQPLTHGATVVPPQVRAQVGVRPPAPIRARPIGSSSITSRPVSSSAVQAPDPTTAYRLGLQDLNNKNYTEAINHFKMAQVAGRPSYDVSYNLGRAYRQYGQAVKDKDKTLFNENMKLAAEQFEQASVARPNSFDCYFQLGMCYHDLELYPKAIEAFKGALRLAPQDPAVYFQLGRVAEDQGYNLEAEAYFLEGLKINPRHALILIELGRLYLKMNQAQSAISVLRQATQQEPGMWEGWYELGRAHMKAREWKVALSALEQARQWNPGVSEIYSAMANCYLKSGKKNEARQMIREALQYDSNNVEANRLQKQL